MLNIRKMFKKKSKGFTLVELVVVIAILAILAAIAVPRVTGTLTKSKQAADDASIQAVESAAQLYYADHAEYPTTITQLTDGGYLDENPLDKVDKLQLKYYTSASLGANGKVTANNP